MLDQANALPKPAAEEIRERLEHAHEKLAQQQAEAAEDLTEEEKKALQQSED